MILVTPFKPLLILSTIIVLLGAFKAILSLWVLFSGGTNWVDKLESNLARTIKTQLQSISSWTDQTVGVNIRNAINGIRFIGAIFSFMVDNSALLRSWAFWLSIFLTVPFYGYISLLFACAYVGVAKIENIALQFPDALIDSLYMPFAWSALPASRVIRVIGGLQAVFMSIVGYNIWFRHLGNHLEKMTATAARFRGQLQDENLGARISQIEVLLAQPKPDATSESLAEKAKSVRKRNSSH